MCLAGPCRGRRALCVTYFRLLIISFPRSRSSTSALTLDKATGRTRKVLDTISDNAAGAGVVLGGRPFRPMDADLRWISAICSRNAMIEDSGVAAAVLNHPANGPAWLANKLFTYGQTLDAGAVILSGSFTALVPANAGDSFHVDYGAYGSIAFRFV